MPAPRDQRRHGRGNVRDPEGRRGDGKLTLLCDELVAFLGGFGRYTDRGAADGRSCSRYDGGPQRVDRIKRGHIYVPNWSVVVAGNIQPRRLAGMADNLIDDGLFQRFLTVHTRPALLGLDDDRPIAPSIGRDYRELHEALAKLRPVDRGRGQAVALLRRHRRPCRAPQLHAPGRAAAGRPDTADHHPRDGAEMVWAARPAVPYLPSRRAGGAGRSGAEIVDPDCAG